MEVVQATVPSTCGVLRLLAGCCGVFLSIQEGGGSVRRVRALQAAEGCFGRLQG